MNKEILITYATGTGSTAEIAGIIYRTLLQKQVAIELLPMKDVRDLSFYRAVIIGSPIRNSRWLPEAMQFLQTHGDVLAKKRIATFTVCITLAMSNTEQYQQAVKAWIAPIRAQVKPVSEGLFAGRLDFSKLPWTLDTLLLRATVALGIFPKGDHLDRNAVQAWATGLHPLLLQ